MVLVERLGLGAVRREGPLRYLCEAVIISEGHFLAEV